MKSEAEAHWYILQVKSGHEAQIVRNIHSYLLQVKGREAQVVKIINTYSLEDHEEKIQETFIPALASAGEKNSRKKILPGYIFIKMHIDENIIKKLIGFPFVYRFLSQEDRPKIISNEEIEQVKTSVQEFSLASPVIKKISVSDEVTIIEGPFETNSGKVEELDEEKGQAKVKILFFGRYVTVSFKISQLKPA